MWMIVGPASTNDISKFVRQNIDLTSKGEPYRVKNITTRSSTCRIEQRDPDLWDKHYSRRTGNFHLGVFSLPWEPYKPIGGDFYLEPEDLVLGSLAPLLKTKTFRKCNKKDWACLFPPIPEKKSEKSVGKSVVPEAIRNQRELGYRSLMTGLRQSRERLKAVMAGVPYAQVAGFPDFDSEANTSTDVMSNIPLEDEEGGDKSVPDLLYQQRVRREKLDYLKYIHTVLVSLAKMGTRDLYKQRPISRRSLRDICTRGDRVRYIREPSCLKWTMDHHAPETAVRQSPHLKKGSNISNKSSSIGRNLYKDAVRLETWEDLLTVYERVPSDGGVHALAHHVMARHARFGLQVKPRYHSINDHTAYGDEERKQRMPLWQQILYEKPATIFEEKGIEEDSSLVMGRIRQNINNLEQILCKELHSELEHLQRTRMKSFRRKMACFKQMKQNTKVREICQLMKQTKLASVTNAVHDAEEDVDQPTWFPGLRNGVHLEMGEDDVDINDALSKIQYYDFMWSKTLHHGKAKLCLFTMSCPAYEICQVSMQSAIKFVMEKLDIGPFDQLKNWLAVRNLPCVITEDQP